MAKTTTKKYNEILKLLTKLSVEEQLKLIPEISESLEEKITKNSHNYVNKSVKTLSRLRGIIKGIDISEEEILSVKYKYKDLNES